MSIKLPKSAKGERALFSERLCQALTAAGLGTSSTALQRAFNERSRQPAITVHAARKWLFAESIPTHARLQVLADLVGVSASWLRFGEVVPDEGAQSLSAQEQLLVKNYRKLARADQGHVAALVHSLADGRRKK